MLLHRLRSECIGLHRRVASAIVTRNVEKTTRRSRLSEPALSSGDAGIRLCARACHRAALPSRGSVGLCIARSHDGADGRRDLGSSTAACSMDPGKNCSQHYNVRPGLDANTVSSRANGPKAPAELLRRECVFVAAGAYPARLPVPADEPQVEGARASDRTDPRSARICASDPSSTSHAGGFAGTTRGRNLAKRLRGNPITRCRLPSGRSQ